MNTPQKQENPSQQDPSDALTLDGLCRACAVQSAFVLTLLEEGVIEPTGGNGQEDWRFSAVHTSHVSMAWRLQRDLGVNAAGAALALQLLDEVHTLRAQLGRAMVLADTL